MENTSTPVISVMQEIIDYRKNHTANETFLYNNRMLSSRCITKEQYNVNWTYISISRLTPEQVHLIATIDYIADIDFVPNDIKDYEALPNPYRQQALKMLDYRQAEFDNLSKSKLKSQE